MGQFEQTDPLPNNTIICYELNFNYLCANFLKIKRRGPKSPLFVYISFMDLYGKINELAESLLGNTSLFLVDLILSDKKNPKKVTVFIDGDNGATIDDCAELSRKLGQAMDDADLIAGKYTLEVSTPGVDHPLKLVRQYKKHIGRNLKVTLTSNELRKGKLIEVGDGFVRLEELQKDKKKAASVIEVPFDTIDKAFVMISFK